jgi:hypothetical protein
MIEKSNPIRSKKLMQSAKGQSCINCGKNNDTICARHYNGLRQYRLGKGRGIKCDDLATAELCDECDQLFSEGRSQKWADKVERSEEFLLLIAETNIRRVKNGVMKI